MCVFGFPFGLVRSALLVIMKVHSSNISFLRNDGKAIDFREAERVDEEPCSGECSAVITIDVEGEIQRLQSLRSYHLLGSDHQDCHHRFATLAAKYFHARSAEIVLVDMERCWRLAGTTDDVKETRETPRVGSIHDKAIMDPAMFYCVTDMESNMRYQKMRDTSGLEDYRFYAATPLLCRDGHRIGVLAVMDLEPRPMPTADEIIFLKDIASSFMELVDQKRSTLRKGVNQSSVGLLRSARFVRDCVKVIKGDGDLQLVLGVHQKEMVHVAATNAEFMCAEFSSSHMEQKHVSDQELVQDRLCGAPNSNNKASHY